MAGARVSPEEFVRIWQTSSCMTEVCEKTGMRLDVAHKRATSYRRQGIALKSMKKQSARLDVEGLAKLAESLLKENSNA